MRERWDVVIVGAGPAGLGCARALQCAGVGRVLVLDRCCVASSFQDWPREMRLITPSFNGNSFDQPDLNSVCPQTSPADMWGGEHLTGLQYAGYLLAFAAHYDLEVREQTAVSEIVPGDGYFDLVTSTSELRATFVIWAAGEFGLPKTQGIVGAHFGCHTSLIGSWKRLKGRSFVVVGGYESGIDAAYHLLQNGARVRVLSSGEPWRLESSDPSLALSPFTKDRLRGLLSQFPERLLLTPNCKVLEIRKSGRGYVVRTEDQEYRTPNVPLLATGFSSALLPVRDLFEWDGSSPKFTESDESTLHRGLFYSGPSLVHGGAKFCFVYKFRARFGVIAKVISERLLGKVSGLQRYAERGFLMEDLSCCLDCRCEIEPQPASLGV